MGGGSIVAKGKGLSIIRRLRWEEDRGGPSIVGEVGGEGGGGSIVAKGRGLSIIGQTGNKRCANSCNLN